MDIFKNVVGIDISKDKFDSAFGSMDKNLNLKILKPQTFENNQKGFHKLLAMARKNHGKTEAPLIFVMEATGVYYENLAYFLSDKNQKVVVVLPNKAKNYARTLDNKSKTDKLDAKMLTQFGLERQMQLWQLPSPIMKSLRALTRERNAIQEMITQLKSKIHAKEYSYQPVKESLKRCNATILVLQKQVKEIEKQIKSIVKTDPELEAKIKNIEKVKGLGFITIVSVIAETNGFALIENAKQLTSYAGFDIVHNESGLKKGRTSISKKGNSHLRHILYMPALTACKFNPQMRPLYLRIISKNKYKRIGTIAIARKLLILIYTLFTKNIEYIPNYKTGM
jgi:transposase